MLDCDFASVGGFLNRLHGVSGEASARRRPRSCAARWGAGGGDMRGAGGAARWRGLIIAAVVVSGAALGSQAGPPGASTLPGRFRDSVVLSGLTNPTVVQFAPDGRIFVGQKNGVIKVFQSLADTNPVTFADLSGEVDDYWDRGLLGLALPPNFPADPYVYVLYAYDAPIGGTAPTWNDGCPTPPGPTTDGCP